jgi:hypothetical protein
MGRASNGIDRAADKQIGEVAFGAETGVKRMLVRYAKLAPVR